MAWTIKLALVSAIAYVALVFAVELLLQMIARHKGSAGIFMSRPLWFMFFATLWTISYWLAYLLSPLARR